MDLWPAYTASTCVVFLSMAGPRIFMLLVAVTISALAPGYEAGVPQPALGFGMKDGCVPSACDRAGYVAWNFPCCQISTELWGNTPKWEGPGKECVRPVSRSNRSRLCRSKCSCCHQQLCWAPHSPWLESGEGSLCVLFLYFIFSERLPSSIFYFNPFRPVRIALLYLFPIPSKPEIPNQ